MNNVGKIVYLLSQLLESLTYEKTYIHYIFDRWKYVKKSSWASLKKYFQIYTRIYFSNYFTKLLFEAVFKYFAFLVGELATMNQNPEVRELYGSHFTAKQLHVLTLLLFGQMIICFILSLFSWSGMIKCVFKMIIILEWKYIHVLPPC